jgi:hypothetical protein
MIKLFEIGEEVSVLIGNEIFEFRCSSIHDERLETNGSVTERRYFGFNSNSGMHMSLSWENKPKERNDKDE